MNYQQENPEKVKQKNVPDPQLFPFLTRRLAVGTIEGPDVDAATAMLALGHCPGFEEEVPSSDHTYSSLQRPVAVSMKRLLPDDQVPDVVGRELEVVSVPNTPDERPAAKLSRRGAQSVGPRGKSR